MVVHTKRAQKRRQNKADASSGGMKKAGLAPQCSIVSRQPMYNRVRRRSMYSKLHEPYHPYHNAAEQYAATKITYVNPSSAKWNLAAQNAGATLSDDGKTLSLNKSGSNPKAYLGPFTSGSLTTMEFEVDATNLSGNLNTNVYVVVPTVSPDKNPDSWDQNANNWINDGNGNYVNCPELDVIETAGYLGGAMSIHASNANMGWGTTGADNDGMDKGMQVVSDTTANTVSAIWNSAAATNGSYEDGISIDASTNKIIVKLTIDYSAETLNITYKKDSGSEITISGGTNFNNLRDKTPAEYKSGMVKDIKSGQYGFYIVSSVWDTTSSGWWACKNNGLTNNGNSSNTGTSSIKILTLS